MKADRLHALAAGARLLRARPACLPPRPAQELLHARLAGLHGLGRAREPELRRRFRGARVHEVQHGEAWGGLQLADARPPFAHEAAHIGTRYWHPAALLRPPTPPSRDAAPAATAAALALRAEDARQLQLLRRPPGAAGGRRFVAEEPLQLLRASPRSQQLAAPSQLAAEALHAVEASAERAAELHGVVDAQDLAA